MDPMQIAMLQQLLMRRGGMGGMGGMGMGAMPGAGQPMPQGMMRKPPLRQQGGWGGQPQQMPMYQGMGQPMAKPQRGGVGGMDFDALRQQLMEAARARGQGLLQQRAPGAPQLQPSQPETRPGMAMMMQKGSGGGAPTREGRNAMMRSMMAKRRPMQ